MSSSIKLPSAVPAMVEQLFIRFVAEADRRANDNIVFNREEDGFDKTIQLESIAELTQRAVYTWKQFQIQYAALWEEDMGIKGS